MTWRNKPKAFQEPILPPYQCPPAWIPPDKRLNNLDYNNNLITFLSRTVHLKKDPDNLLGLFIRGGPAKEYGVYISMVKEGSEAERLGLKSGDKIISINGLDCSDIEHSKVVDVLQSSETLELKVQYFPYGYKLQKERIGMV